MSIQIEITITVYETTDSWRKLAQQELSTSLPNMGIAERLLPSLANHLAASTGNEAVAHYLNPDSEEEAEG